VVPVDPIKIVVPVVVVGELLAILAVVELVAPLAVGELLVPDKLVVAGEPLWPVLLDKSVEAVSVIPRLEATVVCVAPVVSGILKIGFSKFNILRTIYSFRRNYQGILVTLIPLYGRNFRSKFFNLLWQVSGAIGKTTSKTIVTHPQKPCCANPVRVILVS
jgi:hypothetical protein